MSGKSAKPAEASDREILQSRLFEAPRELVWKAWSEPEHISQWWGPEGFTTTTQSADFRTGGHWHHVMHGPDGTDYPNFMEYVEVRKPERIVYTNRGGGETASISFEVTTTFDEEPGGTRVTMRMVFPTAEERDHVVREYGAIEGGKQTLARLAEHLKSM
jgi:uncharacterized protein YndB with AHSA1/START domain